MNTTKVTRRTAALYGRAAIDAARRGDNAALDIELGRLWGVMGYWLTPRRMTTAEFRGESLPPRMIRFPSGRSRRWLGNQMAAAKAWAEMEDPS